LIPIHFHRTWLY